MGLTKRNDSRFWWMDLRINGKRYKVSTKTANKKLAERIYAKAVTEIEEGRWFPSEVKRKTLADMINRYDIEYASKKKYAGRDKSIFKHLKAFFGEDVLLETIERTVGRYEDYRTNQGAQPATVLKELGLLRRMFTVSIKKWRWMTDNPVSSIEMPKVKNERVRYLSQDEYALLFSGLYHAAAPQWLKPLVIVALNTGLRESNILNLRWQQVNLFSRLIVVNYREL
ncbi:MAG TPA: hypothetical protein VFG06_09235 [Thermodesulfovibrionales bacterium]|nr:hypothetical protein [Thermodesulfovibrionales bacterium]